MRTINADTAALDWLETFGGSLEYDEITRLWTAHPREPGYPARSGRTARIAVGAAMRAAQAADAAPIRLHRVTSGL